MVNSYGFGGPCAAPWECTATGYSSVQSLVSVVARLKLCTARLVALCAMAYAVYKYDLSTVYV